MSKLLVPSTRPQNRLTRWLLKHRIEQAPGPGARENETGQHPRWQVVCLTGVDYFSTLGYIPGIALAAPGVLSPIATMRIVLLTLFGALPMYRIVARKSPHGQGSIAMLKELLSFWKGKLFVLCLLGFVATGWVVTITLSASDATAHTVENPFWPASLGHSTGTLIIVTLVLVGLLGAVFLRGLRPLVLVYTLISIVVVVVFAADPTAQAGAYATGVLAMMTSGSIAVTIATRRMGKRVAPLVFGGITLIFAYATVANIVDRPDGITIALLFFGAIIAVSLVSRVQRSLELRQERIDIDKTAQEFLNEAARGTDIHIVAHRRRAGNDPAEYARKEREHREDNHIPEDQPILFLEMAVEDASEFTDVLEVRGVEIGGHKVPRAARYCGPQAPSSRTPSRRCCYI